MLKMKVSDDSCQSQESNFYEAYEKPVHIILTQLTVLHKNLFIIWAPGSLSPFILSNCVKESFSISVMYIYSVSIK